MQAITAIGVDIYKPIPFETAIRKICAREGLVTASYERVFACGSEEFAVETHQEQI